MAANKFATLIHRKTNRITLVLVYAFLEWTLIFFILLNSLFSYFILRFADFFGLKRPCLFCSRLDRFFHSSGKSPSYRDLLCHDHSLQVSRFRFCPTHRRFAESGDFCEDCSSSDDFPTDLIERCSCCGAAVEKRASHPSSLIDLDSGILGFSEDGIPVGEEIPIGVEVPVEQIRSDFVCEEDNVGSVHLSDPQERSFTGEEETEAKLPSKDEKRKEEENRGNQTVPKAPGEKDEGVYDGDNDDDAEEEFSSFISSFDCNKETTPENKEENNADLVMEVEIAQETSVVELSAEKPTEAGQKHLEFYIDGQDCHLIPVEFFRPGEEVREISDSNGDVILDFGAEADFGAENGRISEDTVTFASQGESKQEDDEAVQGSLGDDLLQMENDEEADAEVSIGTEIPDHEQIDDAPSHEINPEDDDDHEQAEETLEFRTMALETERPLINVGVELDEEKLPETPGSFDSLHSPRKASFHLDPRESGTEDSLDGEIESPDGLLTIEKLKSALRQERKALNALYAELEEERSASAVAANETMAMINRLQEEKAAMQMEALQYQRMMEEQSEYDQEALQLMNELMVKREKEKAELEKELELYRKRVEEYESKEKMGVLRRRRRDSSVDSYRNGDLDENTELQHDNQRNYENSDSDDKYGVTELKSTPADAVLCLEECLADFEEERLSILGRLKILEEKLSTLNDEEDNGQEVFEDVKTVDNGHVGENGHFHSKEINGKHKVLKSKRLLPLFDAAEAEVENGLSNGNHYEDEVDRSENGEISIEEEIDELYERLEALEADREFMRHCVGSLRKGDKGVYLLQQILQHLRDLRNVELQVRNAGDMVL